MWLPQEMTEVELVIPEHYGPQVTAFLAAEGVFHQQDVSYLSVESDRLHDFDWRSKATDYANMERHLLTTMKSLGVEDVPFEEGEITTVLDPEDIRPTAEQLEHEVESVLDRLSNTRKQIDKLQNYVDQLTPFNDLEIPFDKIRNRRYVYSVLGIIPVENIARLKTSLTRIPFALLVLKQDQHQAVVLLLGVRQNKDVLKRAARSAYLNAIDLPDEYEGTPGEIVKKLNQDIQKLRQELMAGDDTISTLRSTLAGQFQHLLWRVRFSRTMAEAMSRYGKMRYTYLIVGWVPTTRIEALKIKVMSISDEIVIEARPITRAVGMPDAPVQLNNPGVWGVFEGLVMTYSTPNYKEIDPTLLMAITFPILFGAMFGDVGHGLILTLLGGLLASKKVKKLAGMASMGGVVLLCGLASILFGFLYGSVFGLEDLLLPLWLRPMENIMNILVVTIAAGAGLLTAANLLAMVNAYRRRQWDHFFFGGKGMSGLLLYWALLGLVVGFLLPAFPIPASVFLPVVFVTVLIVFFSDLLSRLIKKETPLIEGGIGTFLIQSFFELFETLIGFLSNTLSYARVGAFAVAHAGLSSVIFILAAMIGSPNSIGYWIVILIGTIFIVGFEGMIVGIQTLRLEYYEFFSKFFAGGGIRYMPLQVKRSKKQGEN